MSALLLQRGVASKVATGSWGCHGHLLRALPCMPSRSHVPMASCTIRSVCTGNIQTRTGVMIGCTAGLNAPDSHLADGKRNVQARHATHVGPPLDEEDGAARVLDPLFSHLLAPKQWLVRGKYFRNYFVAGW